MAATAESHRRLLLAASDILLDEVETLRLQEELEAPQRLRESIRALQIRLGRRNPPVAPATLDAAHDLVFAVQQRLMAANPKNPRPARHAGRASGQPLMTLVREDRNVRQLGRPFDQAVRGQDLLDQCGAGARQADVPPATRSPDRKAKERAQAVWAAGRQVRTYRLRRPLVELARGVGRQDRAQLVVGHAAGAYRGPATDTRLRVRVFPRCEYTFSV